MRSEYTVGLDGSERTSVRVANPAGGKSTISLAWETDPQPQPLSYNGKKYKNESNDIFGTGQPVYMQDVKKKMMYETPNRNYYDDPPTRTYEPPTRSYEPRGRSLGRDMAYQPPEKTSVKVTYAPGGSSNLILGSDGPTNYYKSSEISNQGYSKYTPMKYDPPTTYPTKSLKKPEPTFEKIGSKGYGQSYNQDPYSYGGGMKPSPYQQYQENTTSTVKTSVKVHNPPGGKSTFSFY